MHYDLKGPCSNCPFLKRGGIRLREARVREIAGGMLLSAGPESGLLPCHKTTVPDGEGYRYATKDSRHCAGALIFAERNDNSTQMMRIAERLGLYDAQKLMANQKEVDRVFGTLEEMLRTNRRWSREQEKPREKGREAAQKSKPRSLSRAKSPLVEGCARDSRSSAGR